MSSSRHPIALHLERTVGDPTRLLATVMLLPLVDGIYPALVVAGALDSAAGVLQVGLLVFGGSATLAVVLAEMDGSRRERAAAVLLVGIPLVVLAGLEAALAPTIAALVDLETFARFAAIVVAAVAAKTASARVGELLPRPAVIVVLGAVASLSPTASAAIVVNPTAALHGVAAGLVGVGFALGVALLSPELRANVAVDRFRFGSALALGLLALTVVGFPFGRAPLAAIAVTALFTYDPGVDDQPTAEAEQPTSDAGDRVGSPATAGATLGTVADGGDAVAREPDPDDGDQTNGLEAVTGRVDGERPPWL